MENTPNQVAQNTIEKEKSSLLSTARKVLRAGIAGAVVGLAAAPAGAQTPSGNWDTGVKYDYTTSSENPNAGTKYDLPTSQPATYDTTTPDASSYSTSTYPNYEQTLSSTSNPGQILSTTSGTPEKMSDLDSAMEAGLKRLQNIQGNASLPDPYSLQRELNKMRRERLEFTNILKSVSENLKKIIEESERKLAEENLGK